jgi:type IV fimbrial biogenesis protein FimT
VLIVAMKKPKGFSLIELMVVIAIVAILAVLGLPSYAVWTQNSRIRNAAEGLLNGLQLARSEAVARNTQINFVANANSGWTFGCATVVANTCPAVIQTRSAGEGSTNTLVTVNNATVADTVSFSNFGALVNPAGAMNIMVDSTVLSASESRELRIEISTSGSVRMCDPNLGTSGTDPRRC